MMRGLAESDEMKRLLSNLEKMSEDRKDVDLAKLAEDINKEVENFLDNQRPTRKTLDRVISV